MKKINITVITLALLAFLLISSSAQAAVSANVLYSETDLGAGLWQYDFTFENTSMVDDSHPYLWKVSLDFEEYAYIELLNSPKDWTTGSYIGSLPDTTDYVELYSDAVEYDVFSGGILSGLNFTADYQLGEISYIAEFSDHGEFEDWTSVEGMASPVPVPGAVWLLGSGLLGLAGIRRKTAR